MNKLPKKILLVGLGIIGGSYAEKFSHLGYEVTAIDPNEESLSYALKKGIIQKGYSKVEKEIVSTFEFVVFALYPEAFLSWIKEYHSYLRKGALATDVTGIKSMIIPQVEEYIQDDEVEIVYAHPMAGKETYGVKASDEAIFHKANFVITPIERNKEESLKLIEDMAKEFGFAHIARLSPKEHDEMIAYLSQLAHVIAIALMNGKDNGHLAEYTGNSFRDLTRIAHINEKMWSELFLLNKDILLEQMKLFMDQMEKLKIAIENEDKESLEEMMKESSLRRDAFHR